MKPVLKVNFTETEDIVPYSSLSFSIYLHPIFIELPMCSGHSTANIDRNRSVRFVEGAGKGWHVTMPGCDALSQFRSIAFTRFCHTFLFGIVIHPLISIPRDATLTFVRSHRTLRFLSNCAALALTMLEKALPIQP